MCQVPVPTFTECGEPVLHGHKMCGEHVARALDGLPYEPPMHLDLPGSTFITRYHGFPPGRRWITSTTLHERGSSDPRQIRDRVICVELPDNFVGEFMVQLQDVDGFMCLAAEGRRLPPMVEEGRP
jgi:hypothetical protein